MPAKFAKLAKRPNYSGTPNSVKIDILTTNQYPKRTYVTHSNFVQIASSRFSRVARDLDDVANCLIQRRFERSGKDISGVAEAHNRVATVCDIGRIASKKSRQASYQAMPRYMMLLRQHQSDSS